VHHSRTVQGLIEARAGYDQLLSVRVSIAITAFTLCVLVAVATLVICRRRQRGREAARRHERNPLQGSYAILLVCVAAFVLYLTITTQHNVDPTADQQHPSVVIKVLGSHPMPSQTAKPCRGDRLNRRRCAGSGRRRGP
jgi:heme/copper-type cytochrome/quinol oxidase subunit 2